MLLKALPWFFLVLCLLYVGEQLSHVWNEDHTLVAVVFFVCVAWIALSHMVSRRNSRKVEDYEEEYYEPAGKKGKNPAYPMPYPPQRQSPIIVVAPPQGPNYVPPAAPLPQEPAGPQYVDLPPEQFELLNHKRRK